MATPATRKILLTFLGACAAIGACGTEEPVPANPTWVADVEPILRANCFHCHGASVESMKGPFRWDVYDPTSMENKNVLGTMPPTWFAEGRTYGPSISARVNRDDLLRMPPAPATKLSDRDIAVIKKWQGMGSPQGMRSPNKNPTAKFVNAVRTKTSRSVQISIDVTDADGDQVLGKVELTPSPMKREFMLMRSGRHVIELAADECRSDARIFLKGTLSDGFVAIIDASLPVICPP